MASKDPLIGDVELSMMDETQTHYNQAYSSKGFELPQLSQLPLGQMGYPQAQQWVQQRQANIRPWSLFLNTNNIRAPPSFSRLTKRIMRNIEYFQSNYLFVFLGLVIYCLITSPLLLLTVVLSLGICFKVSQRHAKQELILLGHKLTLAQVYGLVAACSLPLFYLVGAGAALFWVLGVSWFLITIHAAFYNIDSVLCPGEDELEALTVHEV
ncbi:prenylated Rab acceptor protein 1 [Neodiprion pinetum]|uniref:prenylated Rab acceptor protein 1 n=1 Tax=Neodiprion pinetum TaxID=441929 RepID=UPI001EDD7847|nr:prenylated Rab acceptor protein 1 [Neodiprion pinetum]